MAGNEGKTVYTLYTGVGGLINILRAKMKEELPGVRVVTVADDSLLADVRAAGGLIMDAVWYDRKVITVDLLGDEFMETVKNGDKIKISEDGTVEVG